MGDALGDAEADPSLKALPRTILLLPQSQTLALVTSPDTNRHPAQLSSMVQTKAAALGLQHQVQLIRKCVPCEQPCPIAPSPQG